MRMLERMRVGAELTAMARAMARAGREWRELAAWVAWVAPGRERAKGGVQKRTCAGGGELDGERDAERLADAVAYSPCIAHIMSSHQRVVRQVALCGVVLRVRATCDTCALERPL